MPRVLYLAHRLPPEEYTGTPLVTHGYATHVTARGWEASVLYASWQAPPWDQVRPVREPGEGFTRVAVRPAPYANWEIDAASLPPDPDGAYDRVFRRLLERLAPDVVHVVDNVLLPLELPEIAAAAGVPVVRSVSCAEDLCGLIAPVSAHSGPAGYCEAPITPAHCATCVMAERRARWGRPADDGRPTGPAACADGVAAAGDRLYAALLDARARRLLGRLERKRERARAQFAKTFDRIVFWKAGFREYFERTLPLDPDKVRVIDLGMDRSPWFGESRRPGAAQGHVVLCMAGLLDAAKGYSVLVDAFSDPVLVERDDYRLHLLGGGDARLVAPLLSTNPNVHALGSYRVDQLPQLLAGADAGLSISPFETFHRVTREYLLAGLPVIAHPTFGTRGLIRDGVNGLLYDRADPKSLTSAVTKFLDDPRLRERLTAGASATTVRGIDEEVGELVTLYEEVLQERARARVQAP